MPHSKNKNSQLALIIGSLGVVFGDIGTSPLYALNEIYLNPNNALLHSDLLHILGPISLVFWILTLIISIKYLGFVIRADYDGEGGVFALYGQLHQYRNKSIYYIKILLLLAAGCLFGEAMITPAISILSAAEGLAIYNSHFKEFILPFAIAILILLFSIQNLGTHKLGRFFGYIAFLWFLCLALFGLKSVITYPQILHALNPVYAFDFLSQATFTQLLRLFGSILLVITGGEALFTDISHFNKSTIRKSWFLIVYPALLLTYFGQAAQLLDVNNQTANLTNLFYNLFPQQYLLFFVLLATVATFIASQALISALFSLASQSVALGLFPRLKVQHTHHEHYGQIYVPIVNWFLFLGATSLILIFKNSSALASAYGLALSFVMITTTLSMMFLSFYKWKWPLYKILVLSIPFLLIEGLFLFSKFSIILSGGYISLITGIILFFIMRTWKWGRKATTRAYEKLETLSVKDFIQLKENQKNELNKNVVLLVPRPLRSLDDRAPALIQLFYNRYGLIPRNLFLIEVVHRKTPFVTDKRYESFVFCKSDKGTVASTTIHFGFMEEPNLEKVLTDLARHHEIELPDDSHKWLVHTAFERFNNLENLNLLKRLRFKTYVFLRQVTQPAYFYYGLGRDINLSIEILPIKI